MSHEDLARRLREAALACEDKNAALLMAEAAGALGGDTAWIARKKALKSNAGRPQSDESKVITEALEDILSSGPKLINEIAQELFEKGIEIPGQGKSANLIAYLRRVPAAYRVSRGVYALKDDGV